MLNVENWNAPTFSHSGSPRSDGSIQGENPVKPVDRSEHFLDWLQCMRNGKTLHASIDAGYQHSVAMLMAAVSYETGRKAIYDHENRVIRTA